jgi:hypothetical protein
MIAAWIKEPGMRVSNLVSKAVAQTGLSNFGRNGWQEGLEVLVYSVNEEADLNTTGRATFEAMVVALLSRRLEVEDWIARHPAIEAQVISEPLIILGLPRTGSTALHNMLACDPNSRVLRSWESMYPCPPPEAATQHDDPRIAIMAAQMALGDQAMPRMKQMLPMTPISPIEDQYLMGQDFKSQVFLPMFRIPSYARWLGGEADLTPTFRYVKRVLKLLQWGCPPMRWRLKNPSYSQFIGKLDEVFPDARYCMTHRDIADVLPSVTDLYGEMSRGNTNHLDRAWLAEITAQNCEQGLREMLAFRADGNEYRFHDIEFATFQADPLAEIARVYHFLGEELTEQTRARMLAWRADTPRDKHGRHEYHADEFDLDVEALRTRFLFYSDRFGSKPAASRQQTATLELHCDGREVGRKRNA